MCIRNHSFREMYIYIYFFSPHVMFLTTGLLYCEILLYIKVFLYTAFTLSGSMQWSVSAWCVVKVTTCFYKPPLLTESTQKSTRLSIVNKHVWDNPPGNKMEQRQGPEKILLALKKWKPASWGQSLQNLVSSEGMNSCSRNNTCPNYEWM